MNIGSIKTFGDLKKAGYEYKTIKEELRCNLLQKLTNKEITFEGIHGFDYTVIPELERAILSKHNINLLGLRGQAKTRLARQLVFMLDEYIPVVEGSEINDDPFKPISRYAQELLAEKKDETPIEWLHREDRFAEKLATPDVTGPRWQRPVPLSGTALQRGARGLRTPGRRSDGTQRSLSDATRPRRGARVRAGILAG